MIRFTCSCTSRVALIVVSEVILDKRPPPVNLVYLAFNLVRGLNLCFVYHHRHITLMWVSEAVLDERPPPAFNLNLDRFCVSLSWAVIATVVLLLVFLLLRVVDIVAIVVVAVSKWLTYSTPICG